MLPTFNSNKRDNTNSNDNTINNSNTNNTDQTNFVDALSHADSTEHTHLLEDVPLNEEHLDSDHLDPHDPLNSNVPDQQQQQQESVDNDAQIAELLAPYIANLSMNNPALYDQLVHTIDQNRMLNNVIPDQNSDFEMIQQMKRDMKDDLEADWNAVDPVQFLGEEPEEDNNNNNTRNSESRSRYSHSNSNNSIHDDNSSVKSENRMKSFGSILNKIGLGGSESEEEDENEKTKNDDSASLSSKAHNARPSVNNSNFNTKNSIISKPESLTGKISSVLKKSVGLEDDYDLGAYHDHAIDLQNDIELDKMSPERRISGDSILDPHANVTGQQSYPIASQLNRQPGLMHKFLFKYKNQKDGTIEDNLRNQNNNSSQNIVDGNMPSFQSTRPKDGKRMFPKKIVPPINLLPFKKGGFAKNAAITVHITNLLQKQRFMIRLCKALMLYGAPTHRLEDYMKTTSQVLEIDGQFLYLPGCMIISFDTNSTTSDGAELQLVKCGQGVNLWKLHKVYKIYKAVIHDLISVDEANNEIDSILVEQNLYNKYLTVLFYGLASSMVTPFAFGGDWVNIPISFCIGICVGVLQFLVAPKSNLYSNVFEITASIVVSFCARALGSIGNSNICFGSVCQGSLALILPGYIILCGSLELQNKSLLSGSVRMIYAIIYSLFLSFGITLGAALFAWCYNGASSETTCTKNVPDIYKLLWVPVFSTLLALINQAHWSQLFVMTSISCLGYLTTYYSGKHFSSSTEFCASLAAFVIGILGNLYSRIYSGLAVSAILPAIFVQVPSGIASKSSLLTGVQTANQIVNGTTTQVEESNTNALSFGVQMVQVAIGVTVGLFASTLVIYPFGKKKTGLFTL
ncbi:hypothetical protein ACO0SA_003335 [Hanseniaspora valbyensis]